MEDVPKITNEGQKRLDPSGKERPAIATILLVDDHAPTRTTLRQVLERRGFGERTAGCVEEARVLFREQTFDFMISDVGLPDGDGCALIREFRVSKPGFAGIALTGYGMEEDILRTREAGFAEHLTKPVNIEALEKAIAGLSRPS